MENLTQKLINSDNIIEIYQTTKKRDYDKIFTITQNTSGGVFTFWEKHGGYEVTQPIKPNHTTGSGLHVAGDEYSPISEQELLSIVTNNGKGVPNWFSHADIKATQHITAKQKADDCNNIMGYIKIK